MERANILTHQYDHLFKEFLENRNTGWGLYQLIGINILFLYVDHLSWVPHSVTRFGKITLANN